MNAQDDWTLFMETGAPEAYLMYSKALISEGSHVFNDPVQRPQGNGLQ